MARYIKWNDIVSRYKRIADVVGDVEAEDNYIRYAEAYVDGVLAPAFTIPFSNNNATVKDLCIDVAFAKSIMFSDEDKAEKMMTYVGSYMGALKDGSMIMIVGSGETIAMKGEPVYARDKDYTPVFGKGNIIDFAVDSSQLWDEEIARE